jgi:hypothetical protein
VWLKRVHGAHVNTQTIQRIFRDIGMPVLTKTPKRRPRQMKLFEKDEPGDSVQIDVKVVQLQTERVFQYTAIDDCTRYRVLRLYARQNQYSSVAFLDEIQRELPFPVRKIRRPALIFRPTSQSTRVQTTGNMAHRKEASLMGHHQIRIPVVECPLGAIDRPGKQPIPGRLMFTARHRQLRLASVPRSPVSLRCLGPLRLRLGQTAA